jgi:hypothetical protein
MNCYLSRLRWRVLRFRQRPERSSLAQRQTEAIQMVTRLRVTMPSSASPPASTTRPSVLTRS